ncbi:hypothetical protein NQ317_006349, partial [Molorchus minor]
MIVVPNITAFKIRVFKFLENSTYNISEELLDRILEYNNFTELQESFLERLVDRKTVAVAKLAINLDKSKSGPRVPHLRATSTNTQD